MRCFGGRHNATARMDLMRLVKLSLLLTALALSVGAGCAAPNGDASAPGEEATEASESDLTRTSDRALKGKLRGILSGVSFTSEADYEYVVFEGDVVTESVLDEAIVRQKLRAAVQANNSSGRDILPSSCRARALDVDEAIADGDAANVPSDPNDSDYTYAHHDRQLGIALKVMRAQLKSVVGFTFGTNASGDMDDVGTVLYVYVGISKTTGKLIAIMTEAVYT
jgi:hypothetical protein